jgi:hypothetical protein
MSNDGVTSNQPLSEEIRMNRVATLLLFLVVAFAGSLSAAETTVHGRLYTDWEYDLTDRADGMNEFGLGRAYLTVKSKLSNNTSVRITSDLRQSTIEDNGKAQTRYYVIIKYGYLDWTPEFGKQSFKLRLGLQPTPYIDLQNKLWGRRYLAKTVGDMNKFLTSSDAGASIYYAIGEKGKHGTLAAGLYNGTSYSNLGELNKQKDFNLFAQVKPLSAIADLKKSTVVAQYYRGTQNRLFDDTTFAGDYQNEIISVGALLAYRELVNVGADLNWHTEGQGAGASDAESSGASVHATLFLRGLAGDVTWLQALNFFGRYDNFDPDTSVDFDAEQLLIVGIECNPTKGFKASINFRSTSYDDRSVTKKQLVVNTLFKF